jgi:hypothetical protein
VFFKPALEGRMFVLCLGDLHHFVGEGVENAVHSTEPRGVSVEGEDVIEFTTIASYVLLVGEVPFGCCFQALGVGR